MTLVLFSICTGGFNVMIEYFITITITPSSHSWQKIEKSSFRLKLSLRKTSRGNQKLTVGTAEDHMVIKANFLAHN